MIELSSENRGDVIRAQVVGEVAAADWDAAAPILDRAIQQHGRIKLLLDAREFDGWQNLAAAMGHIDFVKAHHQHVDRVAVITARQWQHWLVALAKHFVSAQLKAFEPQHIEAAQNWLETGHLRGPSVSIETAEKDHVLLVRVNGEVSGEDYKTILLPVINSAVEAQPTVNFIVDLTEFRGGDIDALEQDMGARLAQTGHIGRIALVGDQAWHERAERLAHALPEIEIRAFPEAEWLKARHWVAG